MQSFAPESPDFVSYRALYKTLAVCFIACECSNSSAVCLLSLKTWEKNKYCSLFIFQGMWPLYDGVYTDMVEHTENDYVLYLISPISHRSRINNLKISRNRPPETLTILPGWSCDRWSPWQRAVMLMSLRQPLLPYSSQNLGNGAKEARCWLLYGSRGLPFPWCQIFIITILLIIIEIGKRQTKNYAWRTSLNRSRIPVWRTSRQWQRYKHMCGFYDNKGCYIC